MSSQTNIAAFALQDILEGIADGLSDAQRKLRDIEPYDSFGRPNTIYQVPYLDFNLQVTTEFESVTDGDSSKRSRLRFSPAKVTSSNSTKTEIFSSVSGKFIATVPNEGLPQTIIQVKLGLPNDALKPRSKDKRLAGMLFFPLEAAVQNSAGEILTDTTVEFNFDEATSLSLNGNTVIAEPYIQVAEVSTDIDGIASTVIGIPGTEYSDGRFYIFNVNVATINKSISVNNA